MKEEIVEKLNILCEWGIWTKLITLCKIKSCVLCKCPLSSYIDYKTCYHRVQPTQKILSEN